MSLTLLKTNFKKNWILFIIFVGVVLMYFSVMLVMYDPEDIAALAGMLELFPEDIMEAMGFASIITDLTSYLASWLYGMLMLGLPMVYCIILGNRLVAKMVDNSSFAYLLSTPNSRIKIIFTQGFYALASVGALFMTFFSMGVFMSSILHPGLLDVKAFFKLNVTTMLVNMVVIMIAFFFSCLFNDSKRSAGFGAGVPIIFLLMNMIGGASQDLKTIKELSIYGLYDPVKLVGGGEILRVNLIYTGIIIGLFSAALYIFNKKGLPL
ncbi:ABC transporter permease subunit [Alkalibacter mobilis]|uniref:ABC transporter permease subunit n=1 Tax=Alkalibacter mobilis TaxID=2787712 RepID=UPI0018A11686|nr:ABC transporter permease subunit [Alkalibacter mobilis]MBF7097011.1 hypothetical protein [Alkalibacter mobilis]